MVSIIITSYNYGKYIERAIRSCLDQKLDNSEYEIIVVNDCSTDFTEKILENYILDIVMKAQHLLMRLELQDQHQREVWYNAPFVIFILNFRFITFEPTFEVLMLMQLQLLLAQMMQQFLTLLIFQ